MKTKQMKKELNWWRIYGKYVSNVYSNVDAEASGYADGDSEYSDNITNEYRNPFDKRIIELLNDIL